MVTKFKDRTASHDPDHGNSIPKKMNSPPNDVALNIIQSVIYSKLFKLHNHFPIEPVASSSRVQLPLVMITGNPGVFPWYPYPYPPYSHPQRRVRVLAGQGKGLAGLAGIKTLDG